MSGCPSMIARAQPDKRESQNESDPERGTACEKLKAGEARRDEKSKNAPRRCERTANSQSTVGRVLAAKAQALSPQLQKT